jgi:hypothetical protein
MLAACSVYEPGFAEHETEARPGGLGGSAGSSGSGGTGGVAGSEMMMSGISGNAGSAGSHPSGGDVVDPSTPSMPSTEPICGDGEVDLTEKCDISIAAGMPGACPKSSDECAPLANCVPRMLEGSNCSAQCVVLELLCVNDDGCCGPMCDRSNDTDCPANCNDGIVEEDEGETCEAKTDKPCPTEADCDDGEPCTKDVLAGSPDNCNAKCENLPITTTESGDSCCLPDSNHNMDSDCPVVCGNGAREMGEECDGGDGCDASCHLRSTLTADQQQCMDLIGTKGNDCDKCSCLQCAKEQIACRASGTKTRDQHCTEVLQCSNDHDCVKDRCYCSEIDTLCVNFVLDPGPCKTEIDAAAAAEPSGSTNPLTQQNDSNTALGRAVDTTDCNAMKCADVCP